MDRQVMLQQNFTALLRAIKSHNTMGREENVRLALLVLRPTQG